MRGIFVAFKHINTNCFPMADHGGVQRSDTHRTPQTHATRAHKCHDSDDLRAVPLSLGPLISA